jgi:hypothetical protein
MNASKLDELALQAVTLIKLTDQGRIGNGKLRELLQLDESTYDEVRQALLGSGLATSGRGRGGSMVLTDEGLKADPEPKAKAKPPAPAPTPAPAPNPVTQTRSSPVQVSGRDFSPDDLVEDGVVKVFQNRPYNNRNEYCIEVFDELRKRNLTYPGIRAHRQEVDKAMREQRFIGTETLSTIHESANDVLASVGLLINSNIGLVRDTES